MWNMNVYKVEVFWTNQDIIVFIKPFFVRPRIINCKWEGMPTEKNAWGKSRIKAGGSIKHIDSKT